MLSALQVCRTSTGDMNRDPVRCQHSTKVSAPQNFSVFANSRGFSLSGPTEEKYLYSLQYYTCHQQNATSLFAINRLFYEVWDLNTGSSTGSTKSKALLEWQKGIVHEAGISLELLALYPGGRNGSKPLSQPGWQNDSIGPPVPLSTTAFTVGWILFIFPL